MDFSILKKREKLISFFIILLLVLQSCTYLIGYRKIKEVNLSKINAFCTYRPTYIADCKVIDSNYLDRLKLVIKDSIEQKLLYQPLQVHYFINGIKLSGLVNCNASGLIGLDWNKGGAFQQFPPISNSNVLSMKDLHQYEKLLNYNFENRSDTIILLIWTNAFPNQSKKLLNIVCKNLNEFCPNNKIYLFNLDPLYISN